MEKRKNLYGFDFLKIVAASFIVVHHYQQVFKLHFDDINFYGGRIVFGYLVELFFIISGFLTLYSDKLEDALSGIKHKLLRIFPIVTIACLFTIIVKSIQAENISDLWNWKSLIANFLLLFSGYPYFSMIGYNNPTWYLCVLVQCYCLYYLIRAISGKVGISRTVFDIGIIVFAFILQHFGFFPESTYRGFEAFSIGVIICKYYDQFPKKKWICIVLIIASVLAVLIIPAQQRRILTFAMFPAIVILSLWVQFQIDEKARKSISTLGKVSFEVYIWHYPIMATEQMITRVSGVEIKRSYITMFILLILIWAISYPLYRYVEMPINRLIKEKAK